MGESRQSDSAQGTVGMAWEQSLRGKGYASAGGLRFLERFLASPYVQITTRYAKLGGNSLVLEPGCGSGKFSLAFALLGHRVVVLDYVSDVLRGVRATEQDLSSPWDGVVLGYGQGDLESLPFVDSEFDLVINEGVVEHWLSREMRIGVLSEMSRVVRAQGTVAVLVPNGVHPLVHRWDRHLHGSAPPMTYYSADMLAEELRQAGFDNVYTDGIYPWRSWTRLPPWHRLYAVSAMLDRLVPLPRRIRREWGINLIGLGTKRVIA